MSYLGYLQIKRIIFFICLCNLVFFRILAYAQAPILETPIPDQVAVVGAPYSYTLNENTFLDQNEDTLFISLILNDTLRKWLSYEEKKHTLSGTPAVTDTGQYEVVAVAENREGLQTRDTFKLAVQENSPPRFVLPIPDQQAVVGNAYFYRIPDSLYQDDDLDPLSFSARSDTTGLPRWLNFDGTRRIFQGVPPDSVNEVITLVVNVKDPFGGIDSTRFQLAVIPQNREPVVNGELNDQVAVVGETFLLELSRELVIDPDNDPLAYSAALEGGRALPSWLQFGRNSRTFVGIPDAADIDTLSMVITVSDNRGGQVQLSFSIAVLANLPPLLNDTIPDQVAAVGLPFTYTVDSALFSDTEGDTLTIQVVPESDALFPEWLSFDRITRSLRGTPLSNEDADSIVVVVSATDTLGATTSTKFNLTILTNSPPQILNNITDRVLVSGITSTFKLDTNSFFDQDGDSLIYSLAEVKTESIPEWLTFIPDSLYFLARPVRNDGGDYEFTITVRDGRGGQDTTTFTLTVDVSTESSFVAEKEINDGFSIIYKGGTPYLKLNSGVGLPARVSIFTLSGQRLIFKKILNPTEAVKIPPSREVLIVHIIATDNVYARKVKFSR